MSQEINEIDDQFARIGQQVPKWGEGLCEHPPESLPDRQLPVGPFVEAYDFESPSKPSTAEDLQEGVHRLRSKARPFLRKLAPPLESHREKFSVAGADWRLVDRADLGQWKQILEAGDGWESVRLPHYGGPVGPATSVYRMAVELPESFLKSRRVFLCFRGADYKAQVFFNGVHVTEHEGFFEPFEADVSALVRAGKNLLIVRLDNEYPAYALNVQRERVYGEKIYAATGLGWDDPVLGWHHCPPGMGLYQEVFFETRAELHVQDIWVRPLPDASGAEVHVTVRNTDVHKRKVAMHWKLSGSNFEADVPQEETFRKVEADPGLNTWQILVSTPGFRWWTLDEPWLYQAQVVLLDENGATLDGKCSDFGMRTFRISEDGPEKGRLFFNGKEIRLRGANTMGHEQQCVFRGDLNQLRDDILIAKYCGLNFLRITQRPVQKEVYEACDRLGILVQTDLPFFGKVLRSQFAEGVRQAGAMERLIRPHASCFLVSFINEPSPSWTDTAHRHMVRYEFMSFLRACAEIVLYENPDRQIKPIDGDYEPPSPGLPDQHCYCAWYVGHGLDLGRLHRGHWMATKPGWKYACGEFGIEGLDSVDLMRRRYPANWLPVAGAEGEWSPLSIPYAQTGFVYVNWMDAGKNLEEWVKNSQEHQAWGVRMMTRAFRRDRRMVSFAIHLLIDAFPSGWMKAIVDCERNPKPALFEYRDALSQLLADLRCDRWAWWGGETLSVEAWICHDGASLLKDHTLRYVFEINGEPVVSGEAPAEIPACDSRFQGKIAVPLPEVKQRTAGIMRMAVCAPDGRIVHDTEEKFSVFPVDQTVPSCRVMIPNADDELANRFLAGWSLPLCSPDDADVIVSGRAEDFEQVRRKVEAGAMLLLLQLPPGEFNFGGQTITVEEAGAGPRQFVSRATGHPAVASFEKNDFRFWFDPAGDSAAPLLDTVLIAPGWTSILSAPQAGHKRAVRDASACVERKFGRGRVVVCQLKMEGRMATNPPATLFAKQLLGLQQACLPFLAKD